VGLSADSLEFVVEGGVRIPAIHSDEAQAKGQVVYLGGAGKPEDPDWKELKELGMSVLVLHPRGSGPGYSQSGASGYNLNYQLAARTWLLGRNLLAMQASDIVTAVRYLRNARPDLPVTVYAKGKMGPAALLAAVLEPGISRVLLESTISRWQAVVEAPSQQGQENSIVPGVLAHFDLPDLKRLIAPRPLLELSPVGAGGEPIRAVKSGPGLKLRGEG
jgi:hypothetical protein